MKPAFKTVSAVVVGLALGFGAAFFLDQEVPRDKPVALQNFETVLGEIPVPPGNRATPQKVQLGKMLFFDPRLSGNNDMSCATCHNPDKGFSDGLPRSVGVQGELGRNAPTLWNAAYVDFPFWDGRVSSLEHQAGGPITAQAEMNQRVPELIRELQTVPEYRRHFEEAIGSPGINFTRVVRAIATFERTILSFDSPYDRFTAGDKDVLSKEAQRGLQLFLGKGQCVVCHTSPLFTDNDFHVLGVPKAGPGKDDVGRFAVTGDDQDMRAFRTPTLRNIESTGPYMHNGVFETLEQVLKFYNKGGEDVANKSPLMDPLAFTDGEISSVVASLKSLNDTAAARFERPDIP